VVSTDGFMASRCRIRTGFRPVGPRVTGRLRNGLERHFTRT